MNAQHISEEDLVLYSLQSLPAGESSSAERHLEECAECGRHLAEIDGDLALLSLSVDQQPPPAGARDRFLGRIATETQLSQAAHEVASSAAFKAARSAVATQSASSYAQPPSRVLTEVKPGRAAAEAQSVSATSAGAIAPVDAPQSAANYAPAPSRVIEEAKPRRGWFTILIPWAVAFALLALAGYLGSKNQQLNQLLNNDKGDIAQLSVQAARARELMETLTSPAARQVTLTEGKGAPPPSGHASYLAANGALVFVGNNLKPIPAGKTYELWIIPSNGKAPVPAGIFRPDERGSASLVLPNLPDGVPAKAFGVTVENAEGATSPTMPIILSGAAGL